MNVLDKSIKNQVLAGFSKYNLDEKNLLFRHVKDNIFKFSYGNKFITYLEVSKNILGAPQLKTWKTYRKGYGEYGKRVADGDKSNLFDIICLINITDSLEITNNTISCLLKQTKEIFPILIVTNHIEHQIALDNNIDYFWTNEKNAYNKIANASTYVRSTYKEIRNLMLCDSGDIFQDNWAHECFNLMKKKGFDVTGISKKFIADRDQLFEIEFNQDIGRNLITNTTPDKVQNILFYTGILINRILLNQLEWQLYNEQHKNNMSLGIIAQLFSKNPNICYVTKNRIVSIYTDKSLFNTREMKVNKLYKINKLNILPQIDSSILRFLGIPMYELLTKPKPKPKPEKQKSNYTSGEIPIINLQELRQKKEREEQENKKARDNKKLVVAPERIIIIKETDEEIQQREDEARQKEEENNKKIEKIILDELAKKKRDYQYKNQVKYELKSRYKIVTIILHRHTNYILDLCLDALSHQLLDTDICVITEDKILAKNLAKNNILTVVTENNNNDKLDLLEAFAFVRRLGPLYVCILYDNDIIAPDWIREMHAHIKRNSWDIVGKNRAFVYDQEENAIYVKHPLKDQLTHIPIGFRKKWTLLNGKMIYNKILHLVDWDIFLTNRDIDDDTSFMHKMIDSRAKFGKVKTSHILSLCQTSHERVLLTQKHIDIENVKYADYIEIEYLNNLKEVFGNMLGEYKIDFTRAPKVKIQTIQNISNINNLVSDILDEDEYDLELKQDQELTTDNLIVQGLWVGNVDAIINILGVFEQLSIMSYMAKGHTFWLYTYGPMKGVPRGCIIKDANEIIPKSEIFFYSAQQALAGKKTPVAFSNMFRYKMLYDRGGYWVDMDMICVKAHNFKEPYVFSSEWGQHGEVKINAGVIKCPAGSEIMKYCYEVCLTKDKTQLEWGEIGPNLVAEAVNKFKFMRFVKNPDCFCPVTYNELDKLLDPYQMTILPNYYGIHLWNEIWRKNNLDKNTLSFAFIVEILFGIKINQVFNKAGVLINWLAQDELLDAYASKNEKRQFNLSYNVDQYELNQLIDNDIYIDMMCNLQEQQAIKDIHIVLTTKRTGLDSYENEFNYFDGVYTKHRDIHFWHLHNLSDLALFRGASLIFNRGRYDNTYQVLNLENPGSFLITYPATALLQSIQDGNIIEEINKNTSNVGYDIMYLDEIEKINLYKKMYPQIKNFVPIYKKGFDRPVLNQIRQYDIIYNGSTKYPTKNSNLFFEYLVYLNKNKINLRVCMISKFNDDTPQFEHVQIERIDASRDGIKTLFLQSKNQIIMSGRDANPRVISEGLSCGVFCICLDTLSDGYSLFKNDPCFGIVLPTKNKYIIEPYKSAVARSSPELFDTITKQVLQVHNYEEIARKFDRYIIKKYNYTLNKTINLYKKSGKSSYILTLATEDYTKPLNYLLSSINYSNPGLQVVIILVNCRKSLIEQFCGAYKNYKFIDYKISADYSKGMILKLKVKIQRYFFIKYEKPFLWIDADSIVLKNINNLLVDLWNYNLMVYTRFDEDYYMKFAVGVIGFGFAQNIEATKNLLDKYYQEVLITQGVNNWFHDQVALWAVYQQIKKSLKVNELREHEHTLNCNTASMILSRRKKKETIMREILEQVGCVCTNINFDGIMTQYEY